MDQETGLTRKRAAVGAAAGVFASVVQVALGTLEDHAVLPPWEDSNIAPRLMDRLANDGGVELSLAWEWGLGTAFHVGYGAVWGLGYAAARERLSMNPWVGGAALGGLIYGITFPRWGGAVLTGTERPPHRRTPAMKLVIATVTLGFGLATALTYERLR